MTEKALVHQEHVEQKVSTEFSYVGPESFPRQVIFEGEEFRLRHRNPEQENAVYDRFVSGLSGVHQEVELLVVDKDGNVVAYWR